MTADGQKSKLFNAIHSVPFLASTDTSLELYANAYSKRAKDIQDSEYLYDTNEPRLFFKAEDGKVYDSIEELIIYNGSEKVMMGFKDKIAKAEKFLPIGEFSTTKTERNNFLRQSIREGKLHPERVLMPDGSIRFQGKGEYKSTKFNSAKQVKYDHSIDLGRGGVKVFEDGTLTFPAEGGFSLAQNPDGSFESVRTEDIPNLLSTREPKNKVELVSEYLADLMVKQTQRVSVRNVDKSSDLLISMNNFLSDLGFTTTTLENYRESYNNRHGNDPDVQALADMANKVLAFSTGEATVEQMSEEVAHVAIEFYSDQTSIASALSNIHVTEEYKTYNEFYRNKYSQFYEGVELEEQVRKEVLGKVLRNEFIDRFSKEGKNEQRQSIIDKVLNIFQEFINSIRKNLRPTHLQEIQDLTREIADNIILSQKDSFDPSTTSTAVFYEAMESDGKKLEDKLRTIRAVMENMFVGHLKQKTPRQSELDKVSVDMETVDMISALNAMTSNALSQAKIVQSAVEEANSGESLMDTKDMNRFYNLEAISNMLNDARENAQKLSLTDQRLQKALDEIVERVNVTRSIMDEVRPKVNNFVDKTVDTMIEDALAITELTEEEKEAVRAKVVMMKKDQTVLGKSLGLMSKSANPLLNIMAKKVKDINTTINMELLGDVNTELDRMEREGLLSVAEDVYQKDEEGKMTHYVRSPVREDLYDKDLRKEEVRLLKMLTGRDENDLIKALDTAKPKQLLTTAEDKQTFARGIREWGKKNGEGARNDLYEKDKQKRYDSAYPKEVYGEGATISEATKETISTKNQAKFQRDKKYTVDGRVDQSKKSETDKLQDAEDKRNFLSIKDPYVNGQIREGLKTLRGNSMTASEKSRLGVPLDFNGEVVVIDQGYELDTLPEDARIALDLFNLDMFYMREQDIEGSQKVTPVADYNKTIEELDEEGSGSAYEWAEANSTIVLSDSYYDSMGTGSESFEDLVEKFIKDTNDVQDKKILRAHLAEYRELKRRRKSLSKKYRNASNPIELDSHVMASPEMSAIKQLDDEIADKAKSIGLPQEYRDQAVTVESISDRDVNEAFEILRAKSGMSVYDFAISHMTHNSRRQTEDFVRDVTRHLKGQISSLPSKYTDFYNNLEYEGIISESMDQETLINILKEEYAKTKVPSYFQRYSPKGYSKALQAMKSGELKMMDVINKNEEALKKYPALKYIEIRPDYTWTVEINDDKYKNKYHKTGGYYRQPKLFNEDGSPKYLNKEGFFDYYGISVKDWLELPTDDISQLTATKNLKSFELLKMFVANREKTLEDYGDTERVSKYLRPQISRTKMEVSGSVLRGNITNNLKDMVRDVFQNRVDDKVYGEARNSDELMATGASSSVRIVPKYYQQKLESPEIVTKNLVQAMYQDRRQAMLYKKRMEAEGDFNAIMHKISQQRFERNSTNKKRAVIGNVGQVSNYEEKASEYMDAHIYGIQQTMKLETQMLGKTVDLTRLINFLQGWTRFSNLAFNFIVDATSLTTGITVNTSDRFSQEFYHKSSAKRADKLAVEVFKYIAEEGKLNKTSDMNKMLEMFGVESVSERLKNSSLSRTMRLADSSPYLVSKISNMGIKPNLLLATLVDYRFIDGKFRSFPGYVKYMKTKDKTLGIKDIEALFKQNKDESLYNHLNFNEKTLTFNDKFREKFENPQQEFESIVKSVSSRVETMIQIVDTVISPTDKTLAQRNVLTNTLMMHKGWAPINLTKRFQTEYVDFATGKVSEGHYVTLLNYVKSFVNNFRENKTLDFVKIANEMSFDQQSNLKRIGFEAGLLLAIVLFGMLIFGADDDDDSYLEDMLQLIYLRTSSEYNSANLFGITKSTVSIAKSPVTAISTIEQLEPISFVTNLFSFDGDSYEKMFKRLTPYKRIGQLSDLQEGIKNYKFYNRNTIPLYFPLDEERRERREASERRKEEMEEMMNRNN
jgi:hypothetical protein